MTVNILSSTTSSPEESLAWNLQCEIALLSWESTLSRPTGLADIRPQTKRLWRAERAADVMGPVDKGERIMEKKGFRITERGKERRSGKRVGMTQYQVEVPTIDIPDCSFELLKTKHEIGFL